MFKQVSVLLLAIAGVCLTAIPAQAVVPLQATGFHFYLSGPNVQGSEFSSLLGFTSESFDSFPASSPPGTNCASGPGGTGATTWGGPGHNAWNVDVEGTGTNCVYQVPDQFGGAVNGPTNGTPITQPTSTDLPGTNSVALGADTRTTVTFGSPQTYIGFWYSAGDANSSISFYNGSTLVGEFSTKILMTMLNNFSGSVTTLNGATVPTVRYAGNQRFVTTQNATEPYSYVNIIPSDGLTFTSMTMTQVGSGTRFELDNLVSAESKPVNLPGDWVSFPPSLLPSDSVVAAVQCQHTQFQVFGTNFASDPTFTVSPALPAGLTLDAATGIVSGTPEEPSPQTTYTFTATAGAQTASTTIALSVAASSTQCAPDPILPSTGIYGRVLLALAVVVLLGGTVLVVVRRRRRR